MINICPTITASEPHGYREQIERILPFATRIHIDLADGVFTPNKLVAVDNVWWPGGMRADLHVMYKHPFEHLDGLIALAPQLIIVQAEAEGDFPSFAEAAHRHGVEVGVALLPETSVDMLTEALAVIDHVLIFSGNLGYQGGSTADLRLLDKVSQLKRLKPALEIGWDGGVNDNNAEQLIAGGVEVLNVGGFIHRAKDPLSAYVKLKTLGVTTK